MTWSAVPQNAADAPREPLPALAFRRELRASARRDGVVLGPAPLLGHAPRRREPTLLLHALQGGIERPFLHPQQLCRDTLDVAAQGVAVQRAPRLDTPQHE